MEFYTVIKGTVMVILSDPPYKDGNAWISILDIYVYNFID